jgi:acetyltransferase-like isoleucine patch superfamily enzyme
MKERHFRTAAFRLDRLRSFASVWRARLTGADIPYDTFLGSGVEVSMMSDSARRGTIVIGHQCELQRGVIIHAYSGNVNISANVFVGPYCVIYGHGGVTIGSNTLLSMHCRILSSNHTVPAPGILIRSQPDVLMPTRIGSDVWLGAGVTVLGGVTIGDGCVVGAGAVVTHDLAPYSVAIGIPASVVRQRS